MSYRIPRTLAALVLIGTLLVVGYVGFLGVRFVYNSYRTITARISGGPNTQPIQTGTAGTECWNTQSNRGLEVQATLGSGSRNITVTMIVDTGAFMSAAPVQLGNRLGINVYTGTPVALGGIFGQAETGYVHNINLTLPNLQTVRIPVVIMPDSSVPYLLGREGFLDQFDLQVQQGSGTFCLTSR